MPGEPPADAHLFHTATVTVEGYRHHYAYAAGPPGAPVVLALHGFGTTGYRTFRHLAPALHAAGVGLYAPDLLGFGGSDEARDGRYSLRRYAHLTRTFADLLALRRPVLVGHSMGAKVAVAAAVCYPEQFSGLVLVNPGGFSRYARWMPPLAGARWARWLFRQDWFYHGLLPHTPLGAVFPGEQQRREFLRLGDSHHGLDLDHEGLRPLLPVLALPTMLVWGEEDRLLPRSTVRRVLQDLPGTRVVALEKAGHAPMKDQPDALVHALLPFVRQHTRRQRPAAG